MPQTQASQIQQNSEGGGLLKTYELGAVEVTAPKQADYNPATVEIKPKDFKDTNSDNVAQAIRMTPGVLFENTRGGTGIPRIKIRGYWEKTGFYMDGIPMMNVYDRTDSDLQTFTTQGLESVQISKGFVSPIYGINSVGGAVNIVTAKPQKELEFSMRQRLYLGLDTSPGEVQQGVRIGTNQGKYYFSIDATNTDRSAYPLPDSFKGTPTQPRGAKVKSMYKNQTIKLKAGIVPNENHEYSLNYILSKTNKDGMMPADGGLDWTHPRSDRSTVYLLGDSFFTPDLSLNTRLYYDNFAYDRVVRGCRMKDNTLTTRSYSGTGNADASCNPASGYSDREDALGAILTLSYDVAQNSNLKFGVNVRQDSHKRENASGVETQDIRELTSRVFAQYAQRLGDFRFVLAGSYDRLDVLKAHQFDSTAGGAFTDKKPELNANYSLQGAIYYDISESQVTHISVSKKQNMPSIANRYNDSLGRYVKNPDLHSEDVISYELGYDLNLNQTQISANVFYDDKYGVITTQNLPGSSCANPTANTYSTPNVCFQYINDDLGYIYGAEIGATQGFFADNLLVIGVNYSYLQQKTPAITGGNPGTRITAYPNHMFNAKIALKPINSLEIIGSTMLQSPQYSYSNAKGYYDGSNNYFTVDLGANYYIGKGFSVSAGVTNITDRENFVYWGNPSMSKQIFPGRMYFVGVDYKY